jgi:SNF2 family DNA or RNA helicase
LENNITELWSLADMCKPGILGSYFKFTERYCQKDYWGSIVGVKVELMPELKEKLEPIMIRVTKGEALPDLPELTVQEYWVSMTKAQEKLYAQVKAGILENLSTGEFSYLEALAQITRLQQVVDSPYLLREVLGTDDLPVASGKLAELENILKDIDPQKNKFVIFSQYRKMTDIIYEWLMAKQILGKEQIGYIRGGLKASETARIQNGFQEGDLRCIIMTTAGNYGLSMSEGSYVICYDQLFNPQKMAQIYSRVHRGGVKNAVVAINLVTRGSYEERKIQILEGKKELFNAMIDNDDQAFAKLFSKEDIIKMI